jgi:tetratricopeptide (TPR) repeat protein
VTSRGTAKLTLPVLLGWALALGMLLLGGCKPSERSLYQDGMLKMQAQDYAAAEQQFDASLKLNPGSKSALYRKAYCLYKLDKYSDALPLFEQFLKETDNNEWTVTFIDERKDAAFYRDKCKVELGQDVPQNPDAIPPPPMGE